jgi:DNA/RNA-binding domain of Phe-tRNA-synthetase-like protein
MVIGLSGRLPRINPAVDCYNLISVTHTVPVGAYDLSSITGEITIRPARDGDVFGPLGEPDTRETPRPGEIVYADDARVLTRHWNHRDAEHTKVTAGSQSVLFLIETTRADERGDDALRAAEDLRSMVAMHAQEVVTEIFDATGGWRRVTSGGAARTLQRA